MRMVLKLSLLAAEVNKVNLIFPQLLSFQISLSSFMPSNGKQRISLPDLTHSICVQRLHAHTPPISFCGDGARNFKRTLTINLATIQTKIQPKPHTTSFQKTCQVSILLVSVCLCNLIETPHNHNFTFICQTRFRSLLSRNMNHQIERAWTTRRPVEMTEIIHNKAFHHLFNYSNFYIIIIIFINHFLRNEDQHRLCVFFNLTFADNHRGSLSTLKLESQIFPLQFHCHCHHPPEPAVLLS